MPRTATVLRAGLLILSLGLASRVSAQWNAQNPVVSTKQQQDGVVLGMRVGTLRLQVCSDSIVRVTYAPGSALPDSPQNVITKTSWPPVQWTMQPGEKDLSLVTARLKVTITRKDGAIVFSDSAGKKLFADNDRTLTPVEMNGEKTYHSEMFSNLWDSTEAFYGLGQHQAGVWNYHGEAVHLSHDNTYITVPLFLSSNGYGIFWNNASL
jgi:alpha-D-xyloside xylohydrolase